MPVTFLAAKNECRVIGDGDDLGGRYRLGHWDVTKLRAYLERVGTQCLGARANVHRQKMRQHVGGHPKGHQGGEMGAQPIELRRRSTMRWPSDTALDVTAAATTKSRQVNRHLAEWCREQPASPAVDVTPTTTRRDTQAAERQDLPLARRQFAFAARAKSWLRLRQRQAQIGYVAGPITPADLHYVDPSSPRWGMPVSTTRNTQRIDDPRFNVSRPVISMPATSHHILDTHRAIRDESGPGVRLQQYLGKLDQRGVTRKMGEGNRTRRFLAVS